MKKVQRLNPQLFNKQFLKIFRAFYHVMCKTWPLWTFALNFEPKVKEKHAHTHTHIRIERGNISAQMQICWLYFASDQFAFDVESFIQNNLCTPIGVASP